MSGYLVFLHGKGADKSAHHVFMNNLAAAYQAELISFNAPLPYKNGYSWFNKQSKDGVGVTDTESFNDAVDYVTKQIEKRGINSQDVILCGHSQGGAMAVAVGMKLPLRAIISLCGDWPPAVAVNITNNIPKIIWVEGGKDTYLSDERKQSYQYLQKAGVSVCHICDARTEHDVFSPQLLEKIICHSFVK